VVEQQVVPRWLGVEHVQSDPGDATGEQGLEGRVVVDQGSAPAVDQDRSGFGRGQSLGVDQVVGVRGEREMEGDVWDRQKAYLEEMALRSHLGFDPANNSATIYGHGANKISWIAIKDVAAFVVKALDTEAAHNRIIDLGGPEALSPLEVVRLFEAQNEESFQIQYVPEEVLRSQKESAQDPLQQSFAALMVTYAGGAEVPMEETLSQLRVNLTSVSDYRDMLFDISEAAM